MKKSNRLALFLLLAALALIVFFFRDKIRFDWVTFWLQLRHANLWHIGAGIALIYSTYWLRSMRWAVFVAPTKRVAPGDILGPQFIGFTGVALFGRLADLTRPYLVARKIGLPLAS